MEIVGKIVYKMRSKWENKQTWKKETSRIFFENIPRYTAYKSLLIIKLSKFSYVIYYISWLANNLKLHNSQSQCYNTKKSTLPTQQFVIIFSIYRLIGCHFPNPIAHKHDFELMITSFFFIFSTTKDMFTHLTT